MTITTVFTNNRSQAIRRPANLCLPAHARSEGLVVMTHNTAEFARVPGLMVENWVASIN